MTAATASPALLRVSVGQCTEAGRKPLNQDSVGARIAQGALLERKGVACAVADGISSSPVSHLASETAVTGFLADYYSTPDTWSVQTSAERVLVALNAWLHAQSRAGEFRYERDKGHVCTFSALVLRSATAHLFHVGDSRIYRLSADGLEQLTQDHRVTVSAEESYLGRALGADSQVRIDYLALPLSAGDIYLLATDGAYAHLSEADIRQTLAACAGDLQEAAQRLVQQALDAGSTDNLSLQLVRVDALPAPDAPDRQQQRLTLPVPELKSGLRLDGYRLVRPLHVTSRSHLFLAEDEATGCRVAIKAPSVEMRENAAFLERLQLEEWVARRIHDPHVVGAAFPERRRTALYTALEFVEGQTLTQWMTDHPHPDLDTVRRIVEQIGQGLRALHRLEILHQDLRPENIMIDTTGTVRLVDFGAVRVAGLDPRPDDDTPPGTLQYMAPEYVAGLPPSPASDLFSLAVITYQMLCGALPYGARLAQARTRADQRRIGQGYRSLCRDGAAPTHAAIPGWVDDALRKALDIDPHRRQADVAEFLHDLQHPHAGYRSRHRTPWVERDPVQFWKVLALVGLACTLILLYLLARMHAGH